MPGMHVHTATAAGPVKAVGKAKAAHPMPAKKPGCGSGKGGFRPGNTCGKGGRQGLADRIKAARNKAHAGEIDHAELRKVVKQLKEHRRGTPGSAGAAHPNNTIKNTHATLRKWHAEAKAAGPEYHAKVAAGKADHAAKAQGEVQAKVAQAAAAKQAQSASFQGKIKSASLTAVANASAKVEQAKAAQAAVAAAAKAKAAKPKAAPFKAPAPDKLAHVSTLGGSTGAKLMADAVGNKFVVKKGNNEGHIREESAADRLYEAAGIAVPKHTLHETPDGPVKVAGYIEGKTLGELKHSDPAAYEQAAAEVRKHFVADALLGNWDVVGAGHDNILVDKAGKVHRIDNGGSLRYRAQGAMKAGHQWGEQVGEIDSMRHGSNNPGATSVFGKVTDAEVARQIGDLVKKKDKILAAAPADLKDTLGKRIDWLADHKVKLDAKAKVEGAQAKVAAAQAKKAQAHQAKVAAFQAANPGQKLPKHLDKGPAKHESAYDDHSGDVHSADSHFQQQFQPWANSLTGPEKTAVKGFTNSDYMTINGHLWGNNPSSNPKTIEAKVKQIESALAKGQLHKDTAVYRGIKKTGLKAMGIHDPAALIPGQTIHMAGFKSTSIDPKVANSFASDTGAVFRILADAGTKGAYVNGNGISIHDSEKEFLLPHSTQKFKVVKVEPNPHKGYYGASHMITLGIDHG